MTADPTLTLAAAARSETAITVTLTGAPDQVRELLTALALRWPQANEPPDDWLPERPAAELEPLPLTARLTLALRVLGQPQPFTVARSIKVLMREAHAVSRSCVYCGQPAGRWCVTSGGNPAVAHAARRLAIVREERP